MHDAQSVEQALSRLMPPSLSIQAQGQIESMIDELAQSANAPIRTVKWRRLPIAASIAAAIALGWLTIVQSSKPASPHRQTQLVSQEEFTLVSQSDRIETMVDEGWSDTPEGNTGRAMRLQVVGESRLLDPSTGIVMSISQPREEILLMPVSSF
ncbi:MAG: hypothetical protein ACO3RV_02455 [Luteolibacter sp.]